MIKLTSYQAIKYKLTCGIVPGYNNNENPDNICTLSKFKDIVAGIIETIKEKENLSISFTISEGYVLYAKEYGCPDGGEKIFILESYQNPKYISSDDYMEATKIFTKVIQTVMKQVTVSGEYSTITLLYSVDEKDEEETK